MWLLNILLLSSLLAAGTCQYSHLQSYDGGSNSDAGGGGGGGRGCTRTEPEEEPANACGTVGSSNWSGGEQDNQDPRMQSKENAKQRSSGIAVQAAKEAKKANDDMAPAVQAATDKIKSEYAEKATAAANAADAVLFGKSQLLEQLDSEICNAKAIMQQEVHKLNTYQDNQQLALKAHNQLQREVKLLTTILKEAKDKLVTTKQLSSVYEKSVVDAYAVLDAAQQRVNMIMPIRNEVQLDREKTRKAADTATEAAKRARDRITQNEKLDASISNNEGNERHRRGWEYNNIY